MANGNAMENLRRWGSAALGICGAGNRRRWGSAALGICGAAPLIATTASSAPPEGV
ncbi:MAG: hypothetical protein LBB63_03855 [Holosporaceae bacterium]|nr:hypothetical protein [Holosporaceae bacterium]